MATSIGQIMNQLKPATGTQILSSSLNFTDGVTLSNATGNIQRPAGAITQFNSTPLIGATTTNTRSFNMGHVNSKIRKKLGKNFTFGKARSHQQSRDCCVGDEDGDSYLAYNVAPGDIAQYYDVNGNLKQAIGYNEVYTYVEDLLTATNTITLINKTVENTIMTGITTYKTDAANQEATEAAYNVTTTNDITTTLYTHTIADGSNYMVEYSVIGQSNDYVGTWKSHGLVTSSAATLTNTIEKNPDHGEWNVNVDVSSGIFTINVTGKLLERVYWTAMVRFIRTTLTEDVPAVVFSDNNYLTIASDSNLKVNTGTSGNFSISAMFIPYTSQKSVILCKEVSGLSGSSRLTIEMESDRSVRLKIFTGSSTQTFISDEYLSLNKLNYIVWTKSGTDILFYLNNGTPQSYTQSINPSLGSTEYNDWRIGADQSGNFADGIIRSVSIYNTTLTTTQIEEVAQDMGNPTDTSISSSNILGYWPLDETSSALGFADESGNVNTAVEVGTLTYDSTSF